MSGFPQIRVSELPDYCCTCKATLLTTTQTTNEGNLIYDSRRMNIFENSAASGKHLLQDNVCQFTFRESIERYLHAKNWHGSVTESAELTHPACSADDKNSRRRWRYLQDCTWHHEFIFLTTFNNSKAPDVWCPMTLSYIQLVAFCQSQGGMKHGADLIGKCCSIHSAVDES